MLIHAAAYKAFNSGQQEIQPGDGLCRGSRPACHSIQARREQMAIGACSHCDIVVRLDPDNQHIMLIGATIRSWVRLKLFLQKLMKKVTWAPVPYNGRQIFGHLQLS